MKKFIKGYGALILCVVLLAAMVVGGRYVWQQLQMLEENNFAVSRKNNELQEQLSLAETGGLLRSHWLYYESIDAEHRTVRVQLSVLPWTYDPNTRVSVVCNGETQPMTWESGYYRFRTDIPLDASCKVTGVTVAQGDQVEQADVSWELMDYRNFTPAFTSGGYFPASKNGVLSGPWMIHVFSEDMDRFALNVGNMAGTFIKRVDGETVEETPLKWEYTGGMYRAEPEVSVAQTAGQETEYVVSITDLWGINYRYTALRYRCTTPGEDFYRNCESDLYTQVYGPGPNGELLYTLLCDGSMPKTNGMKE